MAFTADELANIANAALDFYIKGPAMSQTIQDKPLMRILKGKQKTFAGGKENISIPVKGDYTTTITGYSHDDTVAYSNPGSIKRVVYPWKEIHAGITMTMTELKKDGISVTDTTTGKGTSQHSDAELTRLTGLLEDKLEDMAEGWARGFQSMLWADGTADAKKIPGLLSIILDDPAPATAVNVGGLSSATTWWRNRAALAIVSNSSTYANQPLVQRLQKEYRQLRRYGGKPNVFLAGSDFLDAFEMELRAKGNYTLEGWSKGGKIDASVADLMFKGVAIEYDPSLDDISRSKYGYWFDDKDISLYAMEGEDMKTHNPARPETKYVMYRAMTYTGGLTCQRRNSALVISIA